MRRALTRCLALAVTSAIVIAVTTRPAALKAAGTSSGSLRVAKANAKPAAAVSGPSGPSGATGAIGATGPTGAGSGEAGVEKGGDGAAAVLSGSELVPAGLSAYGAPTVPAETITGVTSTYDRSAASWTTAVRFAGPLKAARQAKLFVELEDTTNPDQIANGVEIDAWTKPGDLRPSAIEWNKGNGASLSGASATLSADRRTLTLTVDGPALRSGPWYVLNLRLGRDNVTYDLLAPLTLTAGGAHGAPPHITLPAADATLTERKIPQQVGETEHPSLGFEVGIGLGPVATCLSARIEAGGQLLAWNGPEGADCINDYVHDPFDVFPTVAGSRMLAHATPLSGELIIEGWSATGLLAIERMPVSLVGMARAT